MDSFPMFGKVWDEITYPVPNFNVPIEVRELIYNFNSHFTMDVIAYLCRDYIEQ